VWNRHQHVDRQLLEAHKGILYRSTIVRDGSGVLTARVLLSELGACTNFNPYRR
jgi:hypothetical protein